MPQGGAKFRGDLVIILILISFFAIGITSSVYWRACIAVAIPGHWDLIPLIVLLPVDLWAAGCLSGLYRKWFLWGLLDLICPDSDSTSTEIFPAKINSENKTSHGKILVENPLAIEAMRKSNTAYSLKKIPELSVSDSDEVLVDQSSQAQKSFERNSKANGGKGGAIEGTPPTACGDRNADVSANISMNRDSEVKRFSRSSIKKFGGILTVQSLTPSEVQRHSADMRSAIIKGSFQGFAFDPDDMHYQHDEDFQVCAYM
jgi:hypothetical protein